MTRIVADSSTLILLAKCGLLEIVCDLFQVIVPSSVTREVASEELVSEYADAALISELISKKAIKVGSPVGARPTLPMALGRGEQDAISLATNMKDALLATDDGKAIKAARFLKAPFIITPKIVAELYGLQKISLKKARESLEKLGKIGRYSPEIIAEALIRLMEEKNGKTHNYQDT